MNSDYSIFSTEDISSTLFHPTRSCAPIPNGFDVVEFPWDNLTLRVPVWRNVIAPGNAVFFFHGNGETASDWFVIAPKIGMAFDANVFLFDYRGYGKSDGTPTFETMLTDSEAFFEAMLRNKFEQIHVFGRSIGSAPAIHLAWKFQANVTSLVIDSGFAHLPELIERLDDVLLPPIPNGFYDNVDKLREIRIPTLLLHGQRDFLIPISAASENIGAAAADRKRLVKLEHSNHNNTVIAPGYFAYITSFLRGD